MRFYKIVIGNFCCQAAPSVDVYRTAGLLPAQTRYRGNRLPAGMDANQWWFTGLCTREEKLHCSINPTLVNYAAFRPRSLLGSGVVGVLGSRVLGFWGLAPPPITTE